MRFRIRILPLATAVMAAVFAPASAHSGAPPAAQPQEKQAPPFKLEKLTDRAYCLYGQGGNVGILVTDAGVVVVDDQFEEVAQGILDQIRAVTDQPIRYLVNTHYHGDHTGGNPVFVKFAEIIAHETVRPRLLDFPETVRRTYPDRKKQIETEIAGLKDPDDPYRLSLEKDLGLLDFFIKTAEALKVNPAAPPGLTYEGEIRLWLGGEEVDIFHVAPGHTDGDSIVYFPKQKVVHMGDLFLNGMYPFIDSLAGGSARGFVTNIDRVLTRIPPETKVIPGHGDTSDVATLRRFRNFMSDLIAQVQKAAETGMTKIDAVRTIKMDQYPELKPRSRTLGNDVAAVYDELRPGH